MAQQETESDIPKIGDESQHIDEAVQLILFQVPECYVYIVSIFQWN